MTASIASKTAHPINPSIATEFPMENTTSLADQLWYKRGKMLIQQGNYQGAIDSFEMALRLQPNQHKAWMFRGVALVHLKLYESALDSFEQALELAVDDRDAWIFRGAVLTYLNRHTEAMASYSTALQIPQPGSGMEEDYPMWMPHEQKRVRCRV
jgi:tetratricopeptide (TPR) repeat protein